MILSKNYFSNSQFVFCLPTSHLLLTGAANRRSIEIEIHTVDSLLNIIT